MVKKLLLSPERLVCCLEARRAGSPGLAPGARRILALVQHADGRQRALFVLAHSVAGGTEVDIETVLPVTNDFICGIGTDRAAGETNLDGTRTVGPDFLVSRGDLLALLRSFSCVHQI